MKYILTIAGSDSSGGAGIQADIKTVTSLGAHAVSVITAVTAQNSLGISAVHRIPVQFITLQMDTLLDDLRPDAVKIGMLYSEGAVVEVARLIRTYRLRNVVLDPLIRASAGGILLEQGAIAALRDVLLPAVSVATPNLEEAALLSGVKVEGPSGMAEAAKRIKAMGPAVVVTGGHLEGECMDLLYDGNEFCRFSAPRIDTSHTHGSGCVFSTSLAVFLAQEEDMTKATALAHEFTRRAIKHGYPSGRGRGSVRADWRSVEMHQEIDPLKGVLKR